MQPLAKPRNVIPTMFRAIVTVNDLYNKLKLIQIITLGNPITSKVQTRIVQLKLR